MRTALSRFAVLSSVARPPSRGGAAAFSGVPRWSGGGAAPAVRGRSQRPPRLAGGDDAAAFVARRRDGGRLRMSTWNPGAVEIARVGREGLREILEEIDGAGREESGYVVIDVRGEDEIMATGKISEHAETLPLPYIAMEGAFNLDEEDFEEAFGFAKPSLDETIVFSCKAGIRSYQAAQFAAMSGYGNLVNYVGGANEWFS